MLLKEYIVWGVITKMNKITIQSVLESVWQSVAEVHIQLDHEQLQYSTHSHCSCTITKYQRSKCINLMHNNAHDAKIYCQVASWWVEGWFPWHFLIRHLTHICSHGMHIKSLDSFVHVSDDMLYRNYLGCFYISFEHSMVMASSHFSQPCAYASDEPTISADRFIDMIKAIM